MPALSLASVDPPSRRVILLGASNLALGLSEAIAASHAAWGRPLDILTACGHGRGYGTASHVLGRVLPPILECGLWDGLAKREPAPTACLITDIGNDLVLGADADQIIDWLHTLLRRVVPHTDKRTLTKLPQTSLERLSPRRFLFLRTLLFPGSRLAYRDALETAKLLNDTIEELAEEYAAATVEPALEWYGFDPIHIHRRARAAAWQKILATWQDESAAARIKLPALRDLRWRLPFLKPEKRILFGLRQHTPQPVTMLRDGSLLSLF